MYLIVNITKKFISSGYWQLIVLIIIGVMVYIGIHLLIFYLEKDRLIV